MSRRIENFLKRRLGIPPVDPGLAERVAFLETPEAKSIPLSEFEERFGITEVDYSTDSIYYKPDDPPEEQERQRIRMDEFVAGNG